MSWLIVGLSLCVLYSGTIWHGRVDGGWCVSFTLIKTKSMIPVPPSFGLQGGMTIMSPYVELQGTCVAWVDIQGYLELSWEAFRLFWYRLLEMSHCVQCWSFGVRTYRFSSSELEQQAVQVSNYRGGMGGTRWCRFLSFANSLHVFGDFLKTGFSYCPNRAVSKQPT